MIQPITQVKPYKPEFGDILSGGEYLVRKVKNKEDLGDYLWVGTFGNNPWHAIERLGIDSTKLKAIFRYSCPFTDNVYYHFIPVVVILKNGEKTYRKTFEDANGGPSTGFDYLFDLEWSRGLTIKGVLPEANTIQMTMLGHGYTDGTLPNDGSGDFINVLIELDNGDFLFGHCWEWYNK
jgi:hypothetical protein